MARRVFSRSKAAAAAQEVADHLKLIENVRALQTGQKELADAIGKLNERLHGIETDLRALKPEIKLEALQEAQNVVWAVQSGLNDRLQAVAIKLGIVEHEQKRLGASTPLTAAPEPKSPDGGSD